jgi:hypothetical protein
VAEYSCVLVGCLRNSSDGLAWHDQEVHWCLRIDVSEADALIIFINNIRWYFAIGDFLEKGFSRHASLLR